uniref:TRP_2 domain-containing protein n=1 Tax=Trichuris muris TaxID=70415 RepID=A0A5S6QRV0_TRIMR
MDTYSEDRWSQEIFPPDDIFHAIEENDYEQTKKFIIENREVLHSLNEMDLSPLEYAVVLNNEGMVQLFCDYSDAPLRDSLLFAVQCKNQRILKALMRKYPFSNCGTGNSNYFPSHLTPIVLAAAMENGAAYEELLDGGHMVRHLRAPPCTCDQCIAKERDADVISGIATELDSFRYHASLAAVLEERADPLADVFTVCKELQKAIQRNPDRAVAYEELLEKLKKFASRFPANCETSEHVLVMLKRTKGSRREHLISLPLFGLAVETNQKYFLAEPNCFYMLEKQWMGTWSDWKIAPLKTRALRVFCFSILHPFTIIGNIDFGGRIEDFHFNPCAKYISTLSSYICFLFLLNVVACRGTHDWRRLPEDHIKFASLIYVFLYACGWFLITLTELHRFGYAEFATSWWRCYELFQCIAFLAFFNAFIINLLSQYQPLHFDRNIELRHSEQKEMTLEMLFAFLLVSSAWRAFYFLQLNHFMGPLILTVSRSATTIVRYIIIFFVCILAFAIGLNFLYEHYKYNVVDSAKETVVQSDYMTSIKNALRYLYWAWYGYMHPTYKLRVVVGVAGPDENPVEHNIVQLTGNLIAGIYHLMVVISLLHLMTSMMTAQVSDYAGTSTTDYRFQCCKVWVDFFSDCRTYPPPFNLLVFIYNGMTILTGIFTGDVTPRRRISVWNRKYDLPTEDLRITERHEDIIRILVKRIRSERVFDRIPPEQRDEWSGRKNDSLWLPQQTVTPGLSKAAFLM